MQQHTGDTRRHIWVCLVVQGEAFAYFLMYGWVRDQLVKRQILPNQPPAPRLIEETEETDIILVEAADHGV